MFGTLAYESNKTLLQLQLTILWQIFPLICGKLLEPGIFDHKMLFIECFLEIQTN